MLKKEDPDSNQQVKSLLELKSIDVINVFTMRTRVNDKY
jgi:hypothetical protein